MSDDYVKVYDKRQNVEIAGYLDNQEIIVINNSIDNEFVIMKVATMPTNDLYLAKRYIEICKRCLNKVDEIMNKTNSA